MVSKIQTHDRNMSSLKNTDSWQENQPDAWRENQQLLRYRLMTGESTRLVTEKWAALKIHTHDRKMSSLKNTDSSQVNEQASLKIQNHERKTSSPIKGQTHDRKMSCLKDTDAWRQMSSLKDTDSSQGNEQASLKIPTDDRQMSSLIATDSRQEKEQP